MTRHSSCGAVSCRVERSDLVTLAPFASFGLSFADRAYREPLVSPAHAFYFRGMNVVLRSLADLLGFTPLACRNRQIRVAVRDRFSPVGFATQPGVELGNRVRSCMTDAAFCQ